MGAKEFNFDRQVPLRWLLSLTGFCFACVGGVFTAAFVAGSWKAHADASTEIQNKRLDGHDQQIGEQTRLLTAIEKHLANIEGRMDPSNPLSKGKGK